MRCVGTREDRANRRYKTRNCYARGRVGTQLLLPAAPTSPAGGISLGGKRNDGASGLASFRRDAAVTAPSGDVHSVPHSLPRAGGLSHPGSLRAGGGPRMWRGQLRSTSTSSITLRSQSQACTRDRSPQYMGGGSLGIHSLVEIF